jgi:single-strand DNA-binding protein
VSVFGAPGDTVARYTRKGSRVGVDGRLEWREWEAENQERRQAVSVVADRVQFLDTPGESRAPDGASDLDDSGEQSGERELVGAGAGDLEIGF